MAKPKKSKTESFDPLEPTDPDHWRLIVDFPGPMAQAVQAEADRLGINYQATVKTLVDEALRARARRYETLEHLASSAMVRQPPR